MVATSTVRSHVSSKGQVVIPKSLRDAKGISTGSEIEFVDHPEGVLIRLPERSKIYTIDDLKRVLPRYSGQPITDEVMKERLDQGLRERWARKEKNSRP
jgi:AbrB family looped-hinge helix DNA binding protein